MARIAAFEGFYGGSHKQWLDGLVANSDHDIHTFTLSDRFWKWRMHGASVTLAREFLNSGLEPDLILATDMLDLSVLLALIRRQADRIPVVLYMHENQLTYPWSATDPDPALGRDHHYGFINYTSALVADQVWFNSQYHMTSFLEALPPFLGMFPDHQNQGTLEAIREKSRVVPLGIDLQSLGERPVADRNTPPVTLWNHRWEFDKAPDTFFEMLFLLADQEVPFQLVVLGTRGEKYPPVFDAARRRLHDRILQWGPVESRAEYAGWLHRSHILPVTSIQDFFGVSVAEAMYCNVFPLLPDRLAYPEHIPANARHRHLYADDRDLVGRLRSLLEQGVPAIDARSMIAHYDWTQCIRNYDTMLNDACKHLNT
ncbi:MAG: DUF3524 domain-containing protein [Saprospiraceae bacterium]|nr:DUF3524 domain-containing protein [Saprospiraceae bacterium]